MSIWSRIKKIEDWMTVWSPKLHTIAEKQVPVLVTCEKCGCAVVKGQEVRWKAELREPKKLSYGELMESIWRAYDPCRTGLYSLVQGPYIHTPICCKGCAAAGKKKRSHHKSK